ncbi:hypothetical protein ACS0TY_014691 [Phlomoides rotata]
MDYWLTNKRIDAFDFTLPSVVFIVISCTISMGTNLSYGRISKDGFFFIGFRIFILLFLLVFISMVRIRILVPLRIYT